MTAHSEVGASAVHLRGVLLPDDDVADLWVAGDRISRERISGAETIMRGDWLLPGLVDVHTHPGADSPGDHSMTLCCGAMRRHIATPA